MIRNLSIFNFNTYIFKIRILLFILTFLLIGEVFCKVQKDIGFFNTSRVVKFENRFNNYIEMTMFTNNQKFDSNSIRVLILGDSRINGLNIPKKSRFSRIIKRNLSDCISSKLKVYVLDASKPGYDAYENYFNYFRFSEFFKPQIVIWCHNLTDVYFKKNSFEEITYPKTIFVKKVKMDINKEKPLFRKIYDILYTSNLLNFMLPRINKELKASGVFLPGTGAYNLVKKAYLPNSKDWLTTQNFFTDVHADCLKNGTKLIFYIIPELNLLGSIDSFDYPVSALSSFFNKNGIPFLNGIDPFIGKDSRKFAISRYDPHPNEKANKMMAGQVTEFI